MTDQPDLSRLSEALRCELRAEFISAGSFGSLWDIYLPNGDAVAHMWSQAGIDYPDNAELAKDRHNYKTWLRRAECGHPGWVTNTPERNLPCVECGAPRADVDAGKYRLLEEQSDNYGRPKKTTCDDCGVPVTEPWNAWTRGNGEWLCKACYDKPEQSEPVCCVPGCGERASISLFGPGLVPSGELLCPGCEGQFLSYRKGHLGIATNHDVRAWAKRQGSDDAKLREMRMVYVPGAIDPGLTEPGRVVMVTSSSGGPEYLEPVKTDCSERVKDFKLKPVESQVATPGTRYSVTFDPKQAVDRLDKTCAEIAGRVFQAEAKPYLDPPGPWHKLQDGKLVKREEWQKDYQSWRVGKGKIREFFEGQWLTRPEVEAIKRARALDEPSGRDWSGMAQRLEERTKAAEKGAEGRESCNSAVYRPMAKEFCREWMAEHGVKGWVNIGAFEDGIEVAMYQHGKPHRDALQRKLVMRGATPDSIRAFLADMAKQAMAIAPQPEPERVSSRELYPDDAWAQVRKRGRVEL